MYICVLAAPQLPLQSYFNQHQHMNLTSHQMKLESKAPLNKMQKISPTLRLQSHRLHPNPIQDVQPIKGDEVSFVLPKEETRQHSEYQLCFQVFDLQLTICKLSTSDYLNNKVITMINSLIFRLVSVS